MRRKHRTDYLGHGTRVEEREERLAFIVKQLRRKHVDTVVFTGYSGSLMAPLVAQALGADLGFVRKVDRDAGDNIVNTDSHSFSEYEGPVDLLNWVFVDDFVGRGHTLWRVMNAIKHRTNAWTDDGYTQVRAGGKQKLVGVVEYTRSQRDLRRERKDTARYQHIPKSVQLYGGTP